jgi:hypothetical protein
MAAVLASTAGDPSLSIDYSFGKVASGWAATRCCSELPGIYEVGRLRLADRLASPGRARQMPLDGAAKLVSCV